jgi:hypothetical protein
LLVTGPELKQLRADLGDAIGRRLSLSDMARLCGLSDPERNGKDTMRKWEDGAGPSGPVATLLSVLAYAIETRDIPAELSAAGAGVLDELTVENPSTTAESVFGVMMLAEVLRRLS